MTRTEIPENRIICKHVNTQNDYRIRKKRKDVRDYEEKKIPKYPRSFVLGMIPALKKSFVYPVRLWKKKTTNYASWSSCQ